MRELQQMFFLSLNYAQLFFSFELFLNFICPGPVGMLKAKGRFEASAEMFTAALRSRTSKMKSDHGSAPGPLANPGRFFAERHRPQFGMRVALKADGGGVWILCRLT